MAIVHRSKDDVPDRTLAGIAGQPTGDCVDIPEIRCDQTISIQEENVSTSQARRQRITFAGQLQRRYPLWSPYSPSLFYSCTLPAGTGMASFATSFTNTRLRQSPRIWIRRSATPDCAHRALELMRAWKHVIWLSILPCDGGRLAWFC